MPNGRSSRRGNDLTRRSAFLSARPRILIVCEGEKTEKDYFSKVISLFKASSVRLIKCDIVGIGRDPLSVVRRAEKILSEATEEDEYSQVWCVVDVDDHKNIDEAISLAAKREIKLRISNPCFEVWLIWHYADHNSHMISKALKKRMRKYITEYDGSLPSNFPAKNWEAAKRRAIRCNGKNLTSVGNNPSSSVWTVVEAIKSAGSTFENA